MEAKKPYYISTAIAYTSAKPHIGNTYEIVLADAIARYKRMAGYDVQAMISIRLEHPKYNQSFAKQMREHSCVMECFYITGDFDYIARVSAGSTEELTKVLHDIKQIPGVSLTRTYVVLDNIKQSTSVIPRIR